MQRILAHRITLDDDTVHTLSVLEISDDRLTATITPFTHETPSTRFVDGTVVVSRDDLGRYEIHINP